MTDQADARVERTDGGDLIAKAQYESVEVAIYRSPDDGAFVVEVDTQEATGDVRVYLNDGQLYAGDPEEPPSPAGIYLVSEAEVIRRGALAFLHGEDIESVDQLRMLADVLGVPHSEVEALQ